MIGHATLLGCFSLLGQWYALGKSILLGMNQKDKCLEVRSALTKLLEWLWVINTKFPTEDDCGKNGKEERGTSGVVIILSLIAGKKSGKKMKQSQAFAIISWINISLLHFTIKNLEIMFLLNPGRKEKTILHLIFQWGQVEQKEEFSDRLARARQLVEAVAVISWLQSLFCSLCAGLPNKNKLSHSS